MPAQPLTAEQKSDAARLKAIYEAKKGDLGLTQIALAALCGWESQGLLDLSRAIDADSAEQIDEDGRMAERFSSALATVKRIHKNAGYTRSQAQRIKNEKMVAAAAMLVAVCDEYYRAVCQLAWAVAEHDATHAPRLSGFAAESPEEACAMLDRIAFG